MRCPQIWDQPIVKDQGKGHWLSSVWGLHLKALSHFLSLKTQGRGESKWCVYLSYSFTSEKLGGQILGYKLNRSRKQWRNEGLTRSTSQMEKDLQNLPKPLPLYCYTPSKISPKSLWLILVSQSWTPPSDLRPNFISSLGFSVRKNIPQQLALLSPSADHRWIPAIASSCFSVTSDLFLKTGP